MPHTEQPPNNTAGVPPNDQRYIHAARFESPQESDAVYLLLRDLLVDAPVQIAVYKCLVEEVSHIAVVGNPPPKAYDEQFRQALATGEMVCFSNAIVGQLFAHFAAVHPLGSWVEGKSLEASSPR